MKPFISVIFAYYNTPDEIWNAIKSIKSAIGNYSYEIIVIDNASEKKLTIKKNKKIRIIHNIKNFGYGIALNQGVSLAKGEYLLLSNSDVIFKKDSIKNLVLEIKKNKKIGIIAPKILDNSGSICQSISEIPFLPKALILFSILSKIPILNNVVVRYHLLDKDKNEKHFVPAVGGVCMVIKKEVFQTAKGFDPRFFMYFEEADFCYRVSKLGYKVLYYPKSQIVHLVSKSIKSKNLIQKHFEKSRYLFFKKYHGVIPALISELLLRFLTGSNLIVLAIFCISLFMNLYKINSLMMFFGDFGRDYLAARDMILDRTIPLVGIPSSVRWLHQGPLSIYLIGIAFLIGKFNPLAPAILYGIIGAVTTCLIFFLGKLYFNKYVGVVSALFYSTSPLVVLNTRMPYHTSLIPFFACVSFLLLYYVLNGKRSFLSLFFFSIGLLLQVELSNVVVFLIFLLLYFRTHFITKKEGTKSFLGFIVGILPFILYDFQHNFLFIFGFPLWILNRVRLFFELILHGNSISSFHSSALYTTWLQMAGVLFPSNVIILLLILMLVLFSLWSEKKSNINNLSSITILLWLIVPLIGFMIHASPGTAYFPLVYPAFALFLGNVFFILIRYKRFFALLFLILTSYNAIFTIKNDYFLISKTSLNTLPPGSYSYGYNLTLQAEVANFIVDNAGNRDVQIKPGGSISQFDTAVDNYKYLVWYIGGNVNKNSKLIYTIYQNKAEIPVNSKTVFDNSRIFVTYHEEI